MPGCRRPSLIDRYTGSVAAASLNRSRQPVRKRVMLSRSRNTSLTGRSISSVSFALPLRCVAGSNGRMLSTVSPNRSIRTGSG